MDNTTKKKEKYDIYDLIGEMLFYILASAISFGLVYILFHNVAKAETIRWDEAVAGQGVGSTTPLTWNWLEPITASVIWKISDTQSYSPDNSIINYTFGSSWVHASSTVCYKHTFGLSFYLTNDDAIDNLVDITLMYAYNMPNYGNGLLRISPNSGEDVRWSPDYGITYYTIHDNLSINTWHNVRLEYNDDWTSMFIYIDDVVATSTEMFYMGALPIGGFALRTQNQAHSVYYDNLIFDGDCDPDAGEDSKLWFYFPDDGMVLRNDEWSDWSLYSDLTASDLYDVMLLKVSYQDVNGTTYIDWTSIASTTDLTNWVIDKSQYLPDGQVLSWAEMIGTNLENCNDQYETTCIWYNVATSNTINWTSSSTGWTLDDNPWLGVPGFTPASTTADSTEGHGLWDALWNRMTGIFPLSIVFQINTILHDAKNNRQAAVGLKLNDLLVGEYQVPDNPTLLSAATINYGGYWTGTIYPTLNYLVYGVTLFAAIYILWPKENKE